MPARRAFLAEFIGTFALMFVGGGAIIVTGGDNLLAIAFAHGLILAVMVSATMHISGGQINPAVSLALMLTGRQSRNQTIVFIIAQLLGAIFAAYLLRVLMRGAFDVGNLGATLGALTDGKDPEMTGPGVACALEFIATFFLMFVIMGTVVDNRGVGKTAAIGGFGIGMTVAADILCFGPLTGASMNPARSFGPAVAANVWNFQWVYWAGPIGGALAAALVYDAVFGKAEAEA